MARSQMNGGGWFKSAPRSLARFAWYPWMIGRVQLYVQPIVHWLVIANADIIRLREICHGTPLRRMHFMLHPSAGAGPCEERRRALQEPAWARLQGLPQGGLPGGMRPLELPLADRSDDHQALAPRYLPLRDRHHAGLHHRAQRSWPRGQGAGAAGLDRPEASGRPR